MKALVFAFFVALSGLAGFGSTAQQIPRDWGSEWRDTDFSKALVPFNEILSGGVPKDGIPALDGANYELVSKSDIPGVEPVVTVEIEGEIPRAYPIRYLTRHEIVNDVIGEVPVSVTFCPLCNSALVFDGRYDGRVLTFGVSGKLRNSDMVMYDRQTESWWQQFDGEAIIGELTGAELTTIPAWMESLDEFAARNPEGLLMSAPGGRSSYGANPYRGYDSSSRPFLYRGEDPPHGIEPLARVLRIDDTAWPMERLSREGEIIENGLRITWADSGQVSALDKTEIAASRSVGTIRVFDAETGAPVVHEIVFAFAFHAFHPDGTWMLGR